MLTASHNPPNYNGIKFNPADGAPAPQEVTDQIQELANDYFVDPKPVTCPKPARFHMVNTTSEFCESMLKSISTHCQFPSPTLSSTSLSVDAKYGSVAKTWQALSHLFRIHHLYFIHQDPRDDFGGINPNPTHLDTLSDLQTCHAHHQSTIAVANDPDGDRHVILDESGTPVSPEMISVIILDYLVDKGCPVYGISTTVASSSLVKVAAQYHHVEYSETAVGFKFFHSFLKRARHHKKLALAVESSGGFSTSFHTLEKCGFLPVILILLIIQDTGHTLDTLCQHVTARHGQFYFQECAVEFEAHLKQPITQTLPDTQIEDFQLFFDTPIDKLNKKDGAKILFDNGDWGLIRLSGTEPVARIYGESQSPDQAAHIIAQLTQFINTLSP